MFHDATTFYRRVGPTAHFPLVCPPQSERCSPPGRDRGAQHGHRPSPAPRGEGMRHVGSSYLTQSMAPSMPAPSTMSWSSGDRGLPDLLAAHLSLVEQLLSDHLDHLPEFRIAQQSPGPMLDVPKP